MTHQARFLRDSRTAIADSSLQALLGNVTSRFSERRGFAITAVDDWETLRERARQIKQTTLAKLDGYLVQFETQVVARGGHVHWARTVDEASGCVVELVRRHAATRVVKSKSMLSEEIHLNAALGGVGVAAVETDFGEYIVQLAGETPSHIIAPAIHKSRAEIGRLFAQKLGIPYTDDVETLASEARRRLRREFREARVGVSGVNFGVAETGTIVIVENEGNARLCTSMPPVHIALLGIERLIPLASDLATFLPLLPRSATGQRMTSYVSLITGPRRPGELDGPDELHVVLIDNGRTNILANPRLREALQCIRCGACQNVCPIYRNIGGHSYGGVYAGPIGAIVSAHLEPTRATPDLPFVSTLCGACASVCPVKINIPHVLLELRAQVMRGAIPREPLAGRRWQRLAFKLWAHAVASPARYRTCGRILRRGLRFLTARGRTFGPNGHFARWTAGWNLPRPAARSFSELWSSRPSMDLAPERDDARP